MFWGCLVGLYLSDLSFDVFCELFSIYRRMRSILIICALASFYLIVNFSGNFYWFDNYLKRVGKVGFGGRGCNARIPYIKTKNNDQNWHALNWRAVVLYCSKLLDVFALISNCVLGTIYESDTCAIYRPRRYSLPLSIRRSELFRTNSNRERKLLILLQIQIVTCKYIRYKTIIVFL